MKYFKLKLIILLLLLFAALTALATVFGQAPYFFTQLVLFEIVLFLSWQTFLLVDNTNKQIAKFLFALRYKDYALSFPEKGRNSFVELHKGINNALQEVASAAEQKQVQNEWLEPLINRIPIGILVLKADHIIFMNDELSTLLAIPSLKKTTDLNAYQKGLTQQIKDLKPEQNTSIQLENRKKLQFYKVEIKAEERYELFFVQSTEKLRGSIEMDAWLQLIRVLTHEIMNSVTSISSLASTMYESINTEGLSEDLKVAAGSIEKRSNDLIKLTENYREVSNIKAAQSSWFLISQTLQKAQSLLKEELKGISIDVLVENEQQVSADQEQIEQVFINLFLNSISALDQCSNANMTILIKQVKKSSVIQFTDNGKGIPATEQNQIFVPFFTTRKNGKGIGLSLCRQLMRNNNGSISLRNSIPGETIFELRFNL